MHRAWALADLDRVIELDPRDRHAWHNRGVANRKAGRTLRAIPDFRKALRLNPRRRDSWDGRGAAEHAQADHEGSIGDFDAAPGTAYFNRDALAPGELQLRQTTCARRAEQLRPANCRGYEKPPG